VAPANGPFYMNTVYKFTDITDGTSNTAGFAEKRIGSFSTVAVEDYFDAYVLFLPTPANKPLTPDDAVATCNAFNPAQPHGVYSNVGAPWLLGGGGATVYNHAAPPFARWCLFPNNSTMTNSASSWHTNGLNLMLMDGSVRFVDRNISLTTWRAVGSMNGGETLGDDW
jgi:hypothetical protein